MRALWVFLLVILPLFFWVLPGWSGEAEILLPQIFQLDSLEEVFQLLFSSLTELYPQLEGISFQGGILHHYNGEFYLYARDYFLSLTYLQETEAGEHFFVHVQHSLAGEVATVLSWDGSFVPVSLWDAVPVNKYLQAEPLKLDKGIQGLGIRGSTGDVVGRRGEYTIYRYHPGEGYECIWTLPTPSVEIQETLPLELLAIEYVNWDETFPFHDLSSYCPICLGLFSRKIGTRYYWDQGQNTLLPVGREEVLGDLAVVNHLLQALKENNLEAAASFVTQDFYDTLSQISLSFLFSSHLFVYPDIYEWAYRVGYEGEGPLVNMLFSRVDQGGLDLLEEEVMYVVLFALTETHPPLVKDIYVHGF